MRTLFVFAALVALVAAQCSVTGNTYTAGDASVTFGSAVGSWIPSLFNYGDISQVNYGTWKQATATRWEVQEYGSVTSGSVCSSKGQYNVQFLGDCGEISFTVISDPCSARADLLSNAFTQVERSDTGDCVSVGTELDTTLRSSVASPHLSNSPATIIFGADEFAIVSVGDTGALFQRWQLSQVADGETASIVDFGSIPAGLSCSITRTGTYLTDWGEDCAVKLCGISDGCEARAELFHTAVFNDYLGDEECPRPVDKPGLGGKGRCSPNDEQWLKHPYDCVDQDIDDGAGCMFCRGIANGETVSLCLDRQGAACDDIFETTARRAFCNLEFECPASTLSISLIVFISCLVALFFH